MFWSKLADKLGPNKSALTEENSCEYDPKEKHNHIIQAISSEHEAGDQPLMWIRNNQIDLRNKE